MGVLILTWIVRVSVRRSYRVTLKRFPFFFFLYIYQRSEDGFKDSILVYRVWGCWCVHTFTLVQAERPYIMGITPKNWIFSHLFGKLDIDAFNRFTLTHMHDSWFFNNVSNISVWRRNNLEKKINCRRYHLNILLRKRSRGGHKDSTIFTIFTSYRMEI